MAITLQNYAGWASGVRGGTIYLDIPAGPNQMAFIAFMIDENTTLVSHAQFNGIDCTLYHTYSMNYKRVSLYYLPNPPTGVQIPVLLDTNNGFGVGFLAWTLTGVDLANPFRAISDTYQSSLSTYAEVGDFLVTYRACGTRQTPGVPAGMTLLYDNVNWSESPQQNQQDVAYKFATVTGNDTSNWGGTSGSWNASLVSIRPALSRTTVNTVWFM